MAVAWAAPPFDGWHLLVVSDIFTHLSSLSWKDLGLTFSGHGVIDSQCQLDVTPPPQSHLILVSHEMFLISSLFFFFFFVLSFQHFTPPKTTSRATFFPIKMNKSTLLCYAVPNAAYNSIVASLDWSSSDCIGLYHHCSTAFSPDRTLVRHLIDLLPGNLDFKSDIKSIFLLL